MTTFLLAAMILAQAGSAPATPTPAPKADKNPPVTMNGCLTRDYTDAKNVSAYTFIDNTDGARYRATGRNLSKYSGMSVQLTGIVIGSKKVKVVGGLYPNPNVAGQAGNIDPARAAVAAMPGGTSAGTGNVELPTLNVTRLSLGEGECRK
jgi:hypothetical protein